jgi:hypothetical protein
MAEPAFSTLSAHLLWEAQKFLLYPGKAYRTRTNLRAQEILDRATRRFVEWRKTFAAKAKAELLEDLGTPLLLDELYCRDLLKTVPEIVERTGKLSGLTLEGITDPESFVYLREAANCYILGLPQAAVALARAAIEAPLRARAARFLGEKAVAGMELKDLIDRGQALSRDAVSLAHRVRIAANDVLHNQPASSDRAFEVVETAKRVVLELNR